MNSKNTGPIRVSEKICNSSRLLPFSLFGLLSYVEPVLLLGVALLLGESIKAGEWLTYIPIWMAVLVLMFEGFKHLMRHRRP